MPAPTPSQNDVAKRAGVSPMTVSRVLNGTGPVSPEMRARVLQVLEQSGVRRDKYASIAAGKRGGRSASRLVVVDAAHEGLNGAASFAFYSRIVMTALGRLAAAGHTAVLTNLMCGVDRYLDRLVDADAIIYCSPVSSVIHRRVMAINPGLRAVSICQRMDGASLIAPDDRSGGVLAAERAAASGRDRVVVVTANQQESYAERTRAFVERLTSLRPGVRIEVANYRLLSDGVHASDVVMQEDIARTILAARATPTLAFAVGGYATLMLHRFAQRHGLRVPADLAILGFDAMPFYEILPLAIDRVEFSVEALGRLAVDDLLRRFPEDAAGDVVTTLVPCTYVAGESAGFASDPAAAPASAAERPTLIPS